jgi:hypothetical protein
MLEDDAMLNDTTRNDATHNALPTQPTTHTPKRSTERGLKRLDLLRLFYSKTPNL